jgi:hypothetical protein
MSAVMPTPAIRVHGLFIPDEGLYAGFGEKLGAVCPACCKEVSVLEDAEALPKQKLLYKRDCSGVIGVKALTGSCYLKRWG